MTNINNYSIIYINILIKENTMNKVINSLNIDLLINFIINTNLRRVLFNNTFKELSLNYINKYKKYFKNIRYNNKELNSWNSFIIYVILYLIKYNYIDEEVGDILLYKLNYRLFSDNLYKKILYGYQNNILDLNNEIYNNHILLLLAVVSSEPNDDEYINNFLEGIEENKKEQLIKLIKKDY